jgi:cell division protein FtsW (lipid II flippase)
MTNLTPYTRQVSRYTNLILFNHMGAVVTAGILMILGTNEQYRSNSFHWAFMIMPRQLWGALFVVTSLLLYFRPRAWTGAVFSTSIFVYGLSLLAAVLTGHSESLSGWIWVTLVGVNMFLWTAYGRFKQ